ncbi:MAG: AMP-binding protein, partial [Leucothrix sp.]
SAAAIVFTEGEQPKAVVLSHQAIMVNLKQVAEVLNAEGDDVVMASLPLSQAFGLTVTQCLPLIEGLPMVCHSDPNDSVGIAKAIAKYRATLLLGTPSLFDNYTQDEAVQPLMLKSLRLVVSGMEPLSESVQTAFKLKFSKDIYEGYGVTETAPVASVNLPDVLDTRYWQVQQGTKQGSVGMPLPGTSFKIVNPQTLEECATHTSGAVLIGGPQLMQGYANDPEQTADAIVETAGSRWLISGDTGYLDEDGFLWLVNQ